ncbi:LAMI_0F09274g1_1 [Lachancea mirantina]|uniref:DNA-directed DNA polymerase n=1 Tax=Lachancea mirantina TaxID=1230905 RepID=A0A1G4K104_9SACH|nr:LAMI_0F09274g1_1 [Lachancea mirantina]
MDAALERFNATRPTDELPIKRVEGKVGPVDETFKLEGRNRVYERQFYSMYQYRLDTLRERVLKMCYAKWNDNFRLWDRKVVRKQKVLDIRASEPSWCVGTIYCEMKYKPNVLEEVVNDVYGAPDLTRGYTDVEGTDEIMLEDESGRVLLVGEVVTSTPFVSGTVVGILGMEAEAGTFQVVDICYPEPLPQSIISENRESQKIAFISGLNVKPNDPQLSLRIQLLQDFLTGDLGARENAQKIVRLVICGNSMNPDTQEDLPGCLNELGTFFGNVLRSLAIDLMPGENDPSDKSLPQQPLHKALFSGAFRNMFEAVDQELFEPRTNPTWLSINDIDILSVSGQNTDDILRYVLPNQSSFLDESEEGNNMRMHMMQACLRWQNIAPTAPDTLWCYPYKDNDPFILNKWPHVYVVGNQPKFQCKETNLAEDVKVKVISVPEFSKTGELVLFDTKTFEVEVMQIKV